MIPPTTKIFAYTKPVDMRKAFDGLALIAKDKIGMDPQSGALFVFTNKRANRLKVLWFDHNGYCILYKRLHRAVFRLPVGKNASVRIDGSVLAQILCGAEKKCRREKRKS